MDVKSRKKKIGCEQLMLFAEPKSELTALWESLESLKVSHDKVRKRMFAEISEMKTLIATVQLESEKIKFHNGIKPTLRWTA